MGSDQGALSEVVGPANGRPVPEGRGQWAPNETENGIRVAPISDERRDPPDIEKLAKLLIGLARQQDLNQPTTATQSDHRSTPTVN